ncbi:MAG: MTH1187 family thiamine-binding protein [Nanoarchaeota archaeon]|nr:MTH1187 family thiamine-binding protein [Nanoarchaeota archaeon]
MLAQVSIFPTDKGASVSEYVVDAIRYIRSECRHRGMGCEVTSMATLIEGGMDDVYGVVIGAHRILRARSDRVYLVMTIDDRKDRQDSITRKKARIEELLLKG